MHNPLAQAPQGTTVTLATACPFCRGSETRMVADGAGHWAVRCLTCGGSGPSTPDASHAIERWTHAGQSESLLRTVIDESPDIIILKDWDGQFLLGNRALANLYGTTPDQLVGKDDGAFNPNQEQVDFYLENVRGVMRGDKTQIVMEASTDVETGEVHYFQSIKKPLVGPDGEPRILVIAHDVTELQRALLAVEERERSYYYAMGAAGDGIWDWDIAKNVVTHNAKWCELLGFDVADLHHPVETFLNLLHEDDRPAVEIAMSSALKEGGGDYHHEHRMRRVDGQVIWVLDRGQVVQRDAKGAPLRMAGCVTDVSERKRHEQQLQAAREALVASNLSLEQKVAERTTELENANEGLRELARRDVLTRLPNRLAGNEKLDDEFVRMSRTQEAYAILMMDVDWFKEINDSYGHAVGDIVLRHIADVIQGELRDSDFVARYGGEEFMALLPATDLAGALVLGEKIRLALESSPPEDVGVVTVSIGVAVATPDQDDMDVAVRQADAGLYEAKETGRNKVMVAPHLLL